MIHWRIREQPVPRLALGTCCEMTSTDADLDRRTPAWLWPVGAAVALLSVGAFLLWGFGGAGIVLDLIAVYCG
jgi:hypothetical protein